MEFAPSKTLIDEITDFLLTAPNLEQILAFKYSDRLNQRLEDLLERNKQEALSDDERKEVEEFLVLNNLLAIIKAKAELKQLREK
jgi:hypothetical protein